MTAIKLLAMHDNPETRREWYGLLASFLELTIELSSDVHWMGFNKKGVCVWEGGYGPCDPYLAELVKEKVRERLKQEEGKQDRPFLYALRTALAQLGFWPFHEDGDDIWDITSSQIVSAVLAVMEKP